MRILMSIHEMMAFAAAANGWACGACGKAWVDGHPAAVVDGHDPACRHPKLRRAVLR